MSFRWMGSVVKLRWMDGGMWEVVGRDKGWCELKPLDDRARVLAALDPSDRLWVRTRDLTRVENFGDTLL